MSSFRPDGSDILKDIISLKNKMDGDGVVLVVWYEVRWLAAAGTMKRNAKAVAQVMESTD